MKISAAVWLGMTEKFFANAFDNEVTIVFNSFRAYKEYLENPSKIPYDKVVAAYTKTDKLLKKINSNLGALVAALKESPVQVKGLSLDNFDYSELPNQELEIDLTGLDFDDVKTLINMYPWENCKFLDQFNQVTPVSKDRLLRAYNEIDKMIEGIKNYNLSPAEIAYIAFDIARSRIYKKSTSLDNAISRDLHHVLSEDEIVCAGFNNIFCCICKTLGVLAEPVYWNSDNKKSGHVSSVVYINDPKYNIHGIYAFEPTWSCKHDNDDQDYLKSSYHAFIPLSIEQARKMRLGLILIEDGHKNLISRFISSIKRLGRLKALQAPEIIIENEKKMILDYYSEILLASGLDASKEISIENPLLVDNVSPYISLDVFTSLIHNVRAIQHSIDPNHYPNDEETINSIIKSSEAYQIDKRMLGLIKRLLEK